MSRDLRGRMGRVAVVFLLATALVMAGAAGCAKKEQAQQPPAQPAGPQRGGNLVVATDREPDTFDLYHVTWSGGLQLVYESLASRDWDYKYAPALAERWESSPDGLTWTFHLKKGVKFHDGTPLTSQAVKRHFEVLLDPATAAANALDYAWIKGMETPDENTIVFKLDKPYPNLLFRVSQTYGAIQDPVAYEKYGPKGTKQYGTTVVAGTGPFKLKEWVPGDRMVFERNPDYAWAPPWCENQGPPYLDTVTYRMIPDAATRLAELETGNVQILLSLPVEHYDRARQIPNVEVLKEPAFGLGYLGIATDKKPFSDVRVRRAINLAIDREALVKSVFFGLAQPAYGYLPPLLAEFYLDKQAHRYDPEAAKQLLAEAGYPKGFKCTLATQNRTEHVRVAQAIQPMLEAVRIKTDLVQYDEASYVAMLKAGKQELFMRQYSWDSADILQWFLDSHQFPYPNHSRWRDPRTDEMIWAAETSPSMEARTQKYLEVQKYLIDNAVWCPLWYPLNLQAVRTDMVAGYRLHPADVFLNDVWLKTAGGGK
ncbi:MAG: ABC transporter substrate-binding protein [Bacillota bacterium]|nr:ABC transporter substrate-binding protein [Bacillota bacterium]